MSSEVEVAFTGERLHAGSRLFGVDLARHRAAYRFAAEHAQGRRVLDLGCGSGYGAAELSRAADFLLGVDRVRPDVDSRRSRAHFLRADIHQLPIAPACFDLVVSFQVMEHLEDPAPYVDAMARLVRPDGSVIITTPNILTSDRVNPFHVHEYEAEELADCLRPHFEETRMLGVGMSPAARAWMDARLARIRGILRFDVLRLRDRLPRPIVEWAFGTLAKAVRRGIQRDTCAGGSGAEDEPQIDIDWRDFPVGPPDPGCIDLVAICRRPRPRA